MNAKQATAEYLEAIENSSAKIRAYHNALMRFEADIREACPKAFHMVPLFFTQWEDKYFDVLALLRADDDFFDFVTEAARLTTRAYQIYASLSELQRHYLEFLATDPSGEEGEWEHPEAAEDERGDLLSRAELVDRFGVQAMQVQDGIRDTERAFYVLTEAAAEGSDAEVADLYKKIGELSEKCANLESKIQLPQVAEYSIAYLAEEWKVPGKRINYHVDRLREDGMISPVKGTSGMFLFTFEECQKIAKRMKIHRSARQLRKL